MAYAEYIGERYVPQFAEDEIWSSEREYDPLTIVRWTTPEGAPALYVSKTYVPANVSVWNARYWSMWSGPGIKGDTGDTGPQGPPGTPGTGATRVGWIRDDQFTQNYELPDDTTLNGAINWTTAEEPETTLYGGSSRLLVWMHATDDDGNDTKRLLCEIPLTLFTGTWGTTPLTSQYEVSLPDGLTIQGMNHLQIESFTGTDTLRSLTVTTTYQMNRKPTGLETIEYEFEVQRLQLQ